VGCVLGETGGGGAVPALRSHASPGSRSISHTELSTQRIRASYTLSVSSEIELVVPFLNRKDRKERKRSGFSPVFFAIFAVDIGLGVDTRSRRVETWRSPEWRGPETGHIEGVGPDGGADSRCDGVCHAWFSRYGLLLWMTCPNSNVRNLKHAIDCKHGAI